MMKVKILNNFTMDFFDSKTKKKQWYQCDMFKNEVFSFQDIIHGNEKTIRVICLDGEETILNLENIQII
jgi:hypothetical protein